MSYLSLGIIVIIGIIVIAAIFDSNFQEKIFGGTKGEMRLMNFISVRGVSFVVLLIGLIGLAIYHESQQSINTDSIRKEIKHSGDYHFSLDILNKDTVSVNLNNTPIKNIHMPFNMSYKKSPQKGTVYDVFLDNALYDKIELDMTEYFLRYEGGNKIWQDSANRITNSDFWFKLTNIEYEKEEASGKMIATYQFMFGEGESRPNIEWRNERIAITKTDNGLPKSRIFILKDRNWKYSYALILGAGMFGNLQNNNYIEFATINIIAGRIIKRVGD